MGGYVMDHNTIRRRETIDTIRARVIERSYWRQGRRIACGAWTKGSENVGIARMVRKRVEMCKVLGIKLLRSGSFLPKLCQQKWSECYRM